MQNAAAPLLRKRHGCSSAALRSKLCQKLGAASDGRQIPTAARSAMEEGSTSRITILPATGPVRLVTAAATKT